MKIISATLTFFQERYSDCNKITNELGMHLANGSKQSCLITSCSFNAWELSNTASTRLRVYVL